MLRRKAGGRRVDLSDLAAAMADGRVWVRMGVVKNFDGEDGHWFEEDGDIFVDVELAPFGQPCLCRLVSYDGGWQIPAEGTEVIVGFPDGDMEGNAVLLGRTTSGTAPHGLTDSTMVIVCPSGGEVLVTDGSGTAVSLATKADLQAVVDALDGHTHVAPSSGGTTTDNPSVPDPVGTSVLKGK